MSDIELKRKINKLNLTYVYNFMVENWDELSLKHCAKQDIFIEVAEKYNVKWDTLRKKMDRKNDVDKNTTKKIKSHGNQLFSNAKEEFIVGWISGFTRVGRLLKQSEITLAVKEVFGNEKDLKNWDGKEWFKSFKKRHPEIVGNSNPELIDPERLSCDIRSLVLDFVEFWEEKVRKLELKASNCWNADEIGHSPADVDEKVILYGVKEGDMLIARAKDIANHKNHRITSVIFANAAGKIGMIAYIIKTPNNSRDVILPPPKHNINTRGSIFRVYCTSKSGFITKELFDLITQKFIENILQPNSNEPSVLLLDKASQHLSQNALSMSLNNNLHFVYYPSHCSHFLQPCDNLLFALFKKNIRKECGNIIMNPMIKKASWREDLCVAISKAEDISFDQNTIIASFENTGIYPVNKLRIQNNLDKFYICQSRIEEENLKSKVQKMTMKIIQKYQKDSEINQTKNRKRVQIVDRTIFDGAQVLDILEVNQAIKKQKLKKETDKLIKKQEKEKKKQQLKENNQQIIENINSRKNEKGKEMKKNNRCQSCNKINRKAIWPKCSTCDDFKVCFQCFKTTDVLLNHSSTCGK